MNIGIILDCEPYIGGSYQYSLTLLDALCHSLKIRNVSLVAFIKSDTWLDVLLKFSVLRIEKISGTYYEDSGFIDKYGCDFIFCSTQSDWCERLKTPVVTPIHDLMHYYEKKFPEVSGNGEYERREWMFHSIMENSLGILVDSECGKKQACELYGKTHKDKVYVLPFAVPPYLKEDAEAIEIPFHKYIFYPAQFWKHKNHIGIIKAIYDLKKTGMEVDCIFCGGRKNGYDEVVNLITKLGLEANIQVIGYVKNSQMRYLYEHARAMIMPTYFGPTNIPPIEAVSLGCPVAISDVYGEREQLGNAVLYFDPNDSGNIAKVIKRLWYDDALCENLSRREKEIADRFSQETFNRTFDVIFDDLYQRVIKKMELIKEIEIFCNDANRVFIYGAGKYAFFFVEVLKRLSIQISSVVVSDKYFEPDKKSFLGLEMNKISSIEIAKDDCFICAVREDLQEEISTVLYERDVHSDRIYYIDSLGIERLYRNLYDGAMTC